MASIVLSWVDLSVSIRFFWYSDSGRVFGWSLVGVLLSIRSIRSPRLWLDDESRSRAVQFGRVFDRDLTFELVVWLDSEVEDGRMHVLVWKGRNDLWWPQETSNDLYWPLWNSPFLVDYSNYFVQSYNEFRFHLSLVSIFSNQLAWPESADGSFVWPTFFQIHDFFKRIKQLNFTHINVGDGYRRPVMLVTT